MESALYALVATIVVGSTLHHWVFKAKSVPQLKRFSWVAICQECGMAAKRRAVTNMAIFTAPSTFNFNGKSKKTS